MEIVWIVVKVGASLLGVVIFSIIAFFIKRFIKSFDTAIKKIEEFPTIYVPRIDCPWTKDEKEVQKRIKEMEDSCISTDHCKECKTDFKEEFMLGANTFESIVKTMERLENKINTGFEGMRMVAIIHSDALIHMSESSGADCSEVRALSKKLKGLQQV